MDMLEDIRDCDESKVVVCVMCFVIMLGALIPTLAACSILSFIPTVVVSIFFYPLSVMLLGFLFGCMVVHDELDDRKEVAITLLACTFIPLTALYGAIMFMKLPLQGIKECFASIQRTVNFVIEGPDEKADEESSEESEVVSEFE